jgi:hypothetical protein
MDRARRVATPGPITTPRVSAKERSATSQALAWAQSRRCPPSHALEAVQISTGSGPSTASAPSPTFVTRTDGASGARSISSHVRRATDTRLRAVPPSIRANVVGASPPIVAVVRTRARRTIGEPVREPVAWALGSGCSNVSPGIRMSDREGPARRLGSSLGAVPVPVIALDVPSSARAAMANAPTAASAIAPSAPPIQADARRLGRGMAAVPSQSPSPVSQASGQLAARAVVTSARSVSVKIQAAWGSGVMNATAPTRSAAAGVVRRRAKREAS